MKSRLNYLYFLAFLLAAALRFFGLGAIPLTDGEATWALQALSVAQGSKPLFGGQPGYILLTGIPFFLFESNNFLARFWPALAGSFLVFAPNFIREKLGERTALILAFLLAAAPGLVAVSRQANGTMLALTCIVFAWIAWQKNELKWSGIFAGIALLGGPAVWMGLLILGLTWALAQNLLPAKDVGESEASPGDERNRRDDLKVAALYTGGTILLVGTLFLLSPSGLSAWFSSLIDYLRGWRYSSGVPILRMLGGLIAYYPFALLFGIAGIWRGLTERDSVSIALSLWAATALILAVIYPARQVSDLIWAALPLWILSAKEINPHLRLPAYDRNETNGVFALTIILLSFAWINLAGAGILPGNAEITSNRLILLGGSVALLILSLALIAFGWSLETATLGGTWGTALMLALYTLGVAWGSTGLRTPKGVELWDSAARVPQAGLLLETIEQISTWSRGDAQTLNITVNGVNSPALLWVLRNHNAEEKSALDFMTSPELVITSEVGNPELASSYRGQDFVWRKNTDWTSATNWPKWLVLRELPQISERIIFWARNDLFFDSQNQGAEAGIQDSFEDSDQQE
ncbi:MAG: hypothetical protein ISR59_03435 [Anaerolineales bacterium]|uniref:Glycosyltransferase RgtA/B/C/D-like domain-containing protein n=1 Tax=Candidatus Desulfolinea nitratireducens TaxID=2841698 RepID=A0A8J6NM86_9CHLR|nr:hypothetical protein [Candidatus Desulfolinea nitratireducens]MBL6960136.1 hypothetical protein [Anaerolineales bacterium]